MVEYFKELCETDPPAAKDFYNTLIDDMQNSDNPPRWEKNVYPNLLDLTIAIVEQSLFLAEEDDNQGCIVGAFVLNHTQNEAYKKVNWSFPADDDHTAVLHLFATGAKYQHQGIGQKLLKAAVAIARYREDEVIRLDTLTWNDHGQHLYEGFGFHCCGDVVIEYKTTVSISFTDGTRRFFYAIICSNS